MRALAILVATLHVLGHAAVAWLLWFVASFPWENQTPEQDARADQVAAVAVVGFLFSLAILAAVIGRWRWTVLPFALYFAAVVAFVGLIFTDEYPEGGPHLVSGLAALGVVVGLVPVLVNRRHVRH